MYLVNVTNVVQHNIYYIAHNNMNQMFKVVMHGFDKHMDHNFFKLLVSIQTLM